MPYSPTIPLTRLQRLIARGYEPGYPETLPVTYYTFVSEGQWEACTPRYIQADPAFQVKDGIGLIFPTYVARSSPEDNLASIDVLLDQLDQVAERFPNLSIVFFVGVQWGPGEDGEAAARLRLMGERVRSRSGLLFIGMSLPKLKKSYTLNSAFQVADLLKLHGIAWVDDDVKFGSGCLKRLVERFFERGARGSVGARKVPQPRHFRASRMLHWAKQVIKTQNHAYPHGCCMMVDRKLASKGIPLRYTCEDDYYCFCLLRPGDPNPMREMEVVPDALCYHTVGGPAKEIIWRIRRSILTGVITMSDFPPDVTWTYFSRILFNGLWPVGPFDAQRGIRRGVLKWSLKWIYFLWNLQVIFELILRGVFRRPLREIAWSAYSGYELPRVPQVETGAQ